MRHNINMLFIALVFLVILSGCWDRRETEELLLADAMVFDIVNKNDMQQYKITFVTTKSSPGEKGMDMNGQGEEGAEQATDQWIAASYGTTIQQAMMHFKTRSPRYTYLDHNRIIIMGEPLAKHGVGKVLDFSLRTRGIRLTNYILITKGKAFDILAAMPEYEHTFAEEILTILERGALEGDYTHFQDLNGFTQDIITKGQDAWLSAVDTMIPQEVKNAPPIVILSEIAVFQRDKLAGFLNQEETQGFLILKGLANKGGVLSAYKGDNVFFEYNKVRVNRALNIQNDKVIIDYSVKLTGKIKEVHFYTQFTEELAQLENSFSKQAEKILEDTIRVLQDLNSDALGIGRFIHTRNPEFWQKNSANWREIYPHISINVEVEVEIIATEFIKESIINSLE